MCTKYLLLEKNRTTFIYGR